MKNILYCLIAFVTLTPLFLTAQDTEKFYIKRYGYDRYQSLISLKSDSLKKTLSGIPFIMFYDRALYDAGAQIDTNEFMGNFETALVCYEQLLERNALDRMDVYYIGWMYNITGIYEKAVLYYTKALDYAFKPGTHTNIHIIGARGESKIGLKDYYGAVNDLTFAIETKDTTKGASNNKSFYYKQRGRAYALLSRLDDALSDFNNSIKFSDRDMEAYAYRGLLYLGLRDQEKACIDFSLSGQLGNIAAYEYMAKYCPK